MGSQTRTSLASALNSWPGRAAVIGALLAMFTLPRWARWMRFAQYRQDPLPIVLGATLVLLGCAWLLQRWPAPPWARAGRARIQRWAASAWAPLLVWFFSTLYLLVTAWQAGRSLDIPWTDESMHLVQAQLLSRGMLSAPAHPLADHMESFFLFVKPRYAAMYFPGTSLLYVPFLWAGLPGWCFSMAVSGGLVALAFVVARRLMGPGGGLLAALALLSCDQLRFLSIRLVSHHTSALLNLGILYGYLRWRDDPRSLKWTGLLGTLAGLSLLTRPVEAVAQGSALLVMMLFRGRGNGRILARSLVTIGLIAMPWLAIQLRLNAEVTGDWKLPPIQLYFQTYHLGAGYGAAPLPEDQRRVASELPQKTDYFYGIIAPYIRHYQSCNPVVETLSQRLPLSLIRLCAHPLWWVAWTLGVLSLRRDVAVWIAIGTSSFFLLLLPQSHYLVHYGIALAAPLAIIWAAGVRALAGHSMGWVAFWCGTCLLNWPQLNPAIEEGHQAGHHRATATRLIRHQLAPQLTGPAVVLVRYRHWQDPYTPGLDDFHDEPVYTTTTLWPEDSRLALFQALGAERDLEVVRFFAERNPQRDFFYFDRHRQRLMRLGTARDLLERGFPTGYDDPGATSGRI